MSVTKTVVKYILNTIGIGLIIGGIKYLIENFGKLKNIMKGWVK